MKAPVQHTPFDPFDSNHPWNDSQIMRDPYIREALFQIVPRRPLRDLPRRPVTFTGNLLSVSLNLTFWK